MDLASNRQQPAQQQPARAPGEPEKRGRGRPKGHPKTGGRRKKTASLASGCAGQANGAIGIPCTCNGRFASLNLRADDLYDPRLAEEIVTRISNGETLTKICAEQPRMPSDGTVRKWVRENIDGFTARYNQARALSYDAMEDMIRDTSDDASGDFIIDPKNGKPVFVYESVHRSKLKADSLRWILSKQRPERYGDRIAMNAEISGKDGGPIQTEDVSHRELSRVILSIIADGQRASTDIEGEATALGGLSKSLGGPRGLFGAGPGVADAEIIQDGQPAAEPEIDISDCAPGDLCDAPGGLSLEFVRGDVAIGYSEWWVLNHRAERVAKVGSLVEAKALSRQLAETGQINRDSPIVDATAAPSAPLTKATRYSAVPAPHLPEEAPWPRKPPSVVRR